MLKSHAKFHARNGKRLVLVADDEIINRELLGALLQDDYEVIFASDGGQTLEKVKENKDEISLVLLDLMMPVKSGLQVLSEMKSDPSLTHIPVIVLTSDLNAEIECLEIGAIDYIPKPYPPSGIILARIVRAIELSENREIIQYTERDPLTGLYNREYFYHYAEQFDQHHKDLSMDAIVIDINHFHMINERFGNSYGDEVLREIGNRIRDAVKESGGIVCRREADAFMIYCPTGQNYKAILEKATISLGGDGHALNSRTRLRMGVYASVDKSLEVERRFDRAKMAADTIRSSATKNIAYYDNTLHERELYEEQLIEDFPKAIAEKQFRVFFQPKFDVSPSAPILTSAEALVRWDHPTLGLISPGVFIPLFEDNGLIQELDRFVWEKTASTIRDWKERIGYSIPVSVNVSRVDMYDPNLPDTFQSILERNHLDAGDLFLEITESAYTEDAKQITEMVNRLRSMGFMIEMDDFGTGYSSLNFISSLPIDALKLDMLFVRNAFNGEKDTHILEVVIEIANHLSVPVVAEGVETKEQVNVLRELGCNIVQGYYFSKPIPAEEFEKYLIERKAIADGKDVSEVRAAAIEKAPEPEVVPEEPVRKDRSVKLRTVNIVFSISVFIIITILLAANLMVNNGYRRFSEATNNYIQAEVAANGLERGSDVLTESVRAFAVTGDIRYLNDYFTELHETKQRDKAVETIGQLIKDRESLPYQHLQEGLALSNELMKREYRSMLLTSSAYGIDVQTLPKELQDFEFPIEEMTEEEQKEQAIALVFDDEYASAKEEIRKNVRIATSELIRSSSDSIQSMKQTLQTMLTAQSILLVIIALLILAEVLFITMQVRKPLTKFIEQMKAEEKLKPRGASELLFVAHVYNEVFAKTRKSQRQLAYEATHDPLTGLLNRSAYEMFMDNADTDHIALVIVDVDDFKSINDTYGHDKGDLVLKRVAKVLSERFRSVDAICRFGGDEFVVVMTRASGAMQQLVVNKMIVMNSMLQTKEGDLPLISISAGIAFSDRKDPTGDIFKDADTALYRVKNAGRCGCAVYGEEGVVKFTVQE